MSELKAKSSGEIRARNALLGYWWYEKSEADKVISEKDAEIARLKAIRKVHVEAIGSMGAGLQQDAKELRHHKYKRCLAMAEWCESEEKRLEAISPIFDADKECWEYNSDYWARWHERWLELAEKFKEAK